jgi:hypothetical protein
LSEVKDELPRLLRDAEREGIVITRYGKPGGVLIGFASEDDWFDYKLERQVHAFCAGSNRRARVLERGGAWVSRMRTGIGSGRRSILVTMTVIVH